MRWILAKLKKAKLKLAIAQIFGVVIFKHAAEDGG